MTEHARRNWSDSYADGGSIPPASTIRKISAFLPTSPKVRGTSRAGPARLYFMPTKRIPSSTLTGRLCATGN